MTSRTIIPRDEELGKRDDDLKPRKKRPWSSAWRAPMRWRRRRIVLAVVGFYLVYLVCQNILRMVSTDVQFPYEKSALTFTAKNVAEQSPEPTGPPPGIRVTKDASPPHSYSGPIRFYRLAASLHEALNTQGYRSMLRNVLFPISNLKSASVMLPVACEMAKVDRNKIHIAFMGRVDIPIADLLEINGVDKANCSAFWHDARPDYSEYSSEERAEATVAAAIGHVNSFIHPVVVITDDSLNEDAFFTRGIRRKTKQLSLPIIEIPKDRTDSLMWLTRLDAHSLQSWHKPSVDILVQAQSQSSGSLIRLLKSIQSADYSGLKYPRVTIEIPADIDPPTKQFLEKFVWPPPNAADSHASSQLIIRRRIANQRISQEEASIRYLELFYPASPSDSHVLLLSPQAELSPLYYQYTMYSLLDYKYPMYDGINSELVMGISLDLPSTLLDGKTPLEPPRTADMKGYKYIEEKGVGSAPFLWQAPNSHAALYYGDQWVQLHSFLSNRVKKQHSSKQKPPKEKLVSESLPAWAEYMLELMRARGLALLYPARTSDASLVTIHNELYQLPEEFLPRDEDEDEENPISPSDIEPQPFLTADTPPPKPSTHEPPLLPYSRPLHLALPFSGTLPDFIHLPYFNHAGTPIPQENITNLAREFADAYRLDIGDCEPAPKGKRRKIEYMSARDLFCFGDEGEEVWEVEMVFEGPEKVDGQEVVSATATTMSMSETIATATATAMVKGVE
jgi:hypothetical protein